jgi:hypothetical protein
LAVQISQCGTWERVPFVMVVMRWPLASRS